MPVGGSAGSTAINVNAGAKTRWANIFSGLFLLVGVVLLGGLIEQIPMPALAGLLVLAGFRSINLTRILTVWQTSRISATIMGLTLIATLMLPVQIAVFLGVAVSFLMTVISASEQVRVIEIVIRDKGLPEEHPAPKEVPSNAITILQPYGSLFFAGARTLEDSLPAAADARHAVVILLLRGRTEAGSTFIGVLRRYAETLQANGGRLMLTGVGKQFYDQLANTGTLAVLGEENVFPAGDRLFAPALRALHTTARAWMAASDAGKPDASHGDASDSSG